MNIVIEIGWFIASLIVFDYTIKTLGAAKTLSWTFAVSSLVCLWIAVTSILGIIHQHHGFLTLRVQLVPEVLSVLATIYGVACWTGWKGKPSARAWAIAGSVTLILIPLFTIWSTVRFSRSIRGCSMSVLAIGVTGLVAFWRRDERHDQKLGTESIGN